MALNSAKNIGCKLEIQDVNAALNIKEKDLVNFAWQLIQMSFNKINLDNFPELFILKEKEDSE